MRKQSPTKVSTRASRRSNALGVGAHVGFIKLPTRTAAGSRRAYEAQATKDARAAMADIIKKFERVVRAIEGATPDALWFAMKPTFDLSQEYVPYDTGALSESGVLEVDESSSRPRVQITYGAGNYVNYAAIVHERVDVHHAPPTRSKYLQAAFEQTIDGIRDRVIASLRPVVGAR